MNKYLEIWKLNKTYPSKTGPYTVVEGFDLSLRQGEFVSLIGHSGCGKSTVLSIVAGLTDKTSGAIVLAGKELRGSRPGSRRGVPGRACSPWMSAFDNVMLGVNQVMPSASEQARKDLAAHYLTLIGLKDSMHMLPASLSQGMKQRVGIARAFALNPKMLLLDEPFGMLDSLTRYELQQVLIDLWSKDQKTALMVTHDVDEALFLSDRIVMMTNGPRAHVGEILDVTFPRPRNRTEVMDHPDYYRLRERLISFLEKHDIRKSKQADAIAAVA